MVSVMPSAEHESSVALAKLTPDLCAWLLASVFDVKVPDYDHARTHEAEVQVLVPRTYHADSMMLFCDSDDKPLTAVVLEVQRGWDPGKRRTWKLYVAQLETELDVDTALLVYCPDPDIARRYRAMFEAGGLSLSLRPFIFTPEDIPLVVSVDQARSNPALAVLSAICHGNDAQVDATFPALAEAMRILGPKRALLYYDVVLAGLPTATRVRWEAFMSTTIGSEYRSELFRELAAQAEARGTALGEARGEARGKALGEARGEARAIVMVLEARGVTVPTEVHDQILACTDPAQLETWLGRAGTATAADDVLRG